MKAVRDTARSVVRRLFRAPPSPASAIGGRSGRGAQPPSGSIAAFAALLAVVAWGLGAFAAWPWAATAPDAAVVRVSLKHVSDFAAAEWGRTPEDEEAREREIERRPRHMRPLDPSRPTTGRRADAVLTVVIDGWTALERSYRPTGLRHDGPIYAYEEVGVAPGRHHVSVALVDRPGSAHRRSLARVLDIRAGHAPLVEYTDGAGWRVGAAPALETTQELETQDQEDTGHDNP